MDLKKSANKKLNFQKGDLGEKKAIHFLKQKGFSILDEHFYFQHGEIDIVARDKNELVFVEVKYRKQKNFGSPEESITEKKQTILRRTAEGYLYKKNLTDVACRFDVVSILENKNKSTLHYFKNAF
ncbi:MAG: YraN family protein [Bacteroidetes bacterium]|nr:YraN family protein [Bacteroidota bacterium]